MAYLYSLLVKKVIGWAVTQYAMKLYRRWRDRMKKKGVKTPERSVTGTVEIELIDEHGRVIDKRKVTNLIVNNGLAYIASRLLNDSRQPISHMALGTGSSLTTAEHTSLDAQIDEKIDFLSTIISGYFNDEITYVAEFPPGMATGPIREAGLFNEDLSNNLIARTTFLVMNKGDADSIRLTWSISILYEGLSPVYNFNTLETITPTGYVERSTSADYIDPDTSNTVTAPANVERVEENGLLINLGNEYARWNSGNFVDPGDLPSGCIYLDLMLSQSLKSLVSPTQFVSILNAGPRADLASSKYNYQLLGIDVDGNWAFQASGMSALQKFHPSANDDIGGGLSIRLAIAWERNNSISLYHNGRLVGSRPFTSWPYFPMLNFGGLLDPTATLFYKGHLRSIVHYNYRPSNAMLKDITKTGV